MSDEKNLMTPEEATAGAVAHATMGLMAPLTKLLASLLHELVQVQAINDDAVERILEAATNASTQDERSKPFEVMQKDITNAFIAGLRAEILDRAPAF